MRADTLLLWLVLVYIGPSPTVEKTDERENAKQLTLAPTTSAIGPCPTIIQIKIGRPGTDSLPSRFAPPDYLLLPLCIVKLSWQNFSAVRHILLLLGRFVYFTFLFLQTGQIYYKCNYGDIVIISVSSCFCMGPLPSDGIGRIIKILEKELTHLKNWDHFFPNNYDISEHMYTKELIRCLSFDLNYTSKAYPNILH